MATQTPLKVKIIIGSTRPKRFSEHAARWIAELARHKEGMEAELLDLRDYPMPFFDAPVSPAFAAAPYDNPAVRQWQAKIAEGDAFIIITPEYNHGSSGVLKNALDWVYAEWNKKPVGFVSYGSVGGGRADVAVRIKGDALTT